MTNTPPGWFPAPDNSGRQQWWNGVQWSDQFAPGQQPAVYAPVQPKKSYLGLILGIVGGVVVLGIIVTVIVVGAIVSTISSTNQLLDPILGGESDVPTYNIVDRPGWDPLVERYQDEFDKYQNISDSELYAIVPMNADGLSYYKDFLYLLADRKGAVGFLGVATLSTDPQELDDTIVYWDNELTELERTFVAGEDFDTTIKITQSDGTVYESDGTFPTVDVDAALAFLASYQGQPDAAGSYLPAAQAMLDQFGMLFSWAPGTNISSCTSNGSTTPALASYCSLDPGIIYLNSQLIDVNDPDLLNTIRHELAHHVIAVTCGVVSPPIIGPTPEGVTSSYAVLFMGADDTLDDGRSAPYQMTAATDAIATSIHAGDCG